MNNGRADTAILILFTLVLAVLAVAVGVLINIATMRYAWGIELQSLWALIWLSIFGGGLSGIFSGIIKAIWKD